MQTLYINRYHIISLEFINNLFEKYEKWGKLLNHIKREDKVTLHMAKASIDVRAFHSYVKTKDIVIPNWEDSPRLCHVYWMGLEQWWQRDSERRTFFVTIKTGWLSVDQFDFFVELRWKRARATVDLWRNQNPQLLCKIHEGEKNGTGKRNRGRMFVHGLNIMHVSRGIQQNAWCAVLHRWKEEGISDSEHLCISWTTNGKMSLFVSRRLSILILNMTLLISIDGYRLHREIKMAPDTPTVSTLTRSRYQSKVSLWEKRKINELLF